MKKFNMVKKGLSCSKFLEIAATGMTGSYRGGKKI